MLDETPEEKAKWEAELAPGARTVSLDMWALLNERVSCGSFELGCGIWAVAVGCSCWHSECIQLSSENMSQMDISS